MPREERLVGRILAQLTTAMRGVYPDAQLAAYVQSVGERVAKVSDRPELAWRFHVVDDPEVDAHALPGGQVVVSRGTLAWLGSEAELAAVLAHEIAHGAQRHPRLRDSGSVPPAWDADVEERAHRLDAAEERQADALAVEYLARAGYDPHAIQSALEAILRGAAADCAAEADVCGANEGDPHPARPARLARVAVAAGARRGQRFVERYLRHIDGLALGASSRTPRLEGNRYVVPGRLSFSLPAGRSPEVTGSIVTTRQGEPRLSIATFAGAFWRDSLRGALEKEPHQWRRVLGRRVLVGRLGGEGPPVRAAFVEGTHDDFFLLAAEGDDPKAQKALEALLSSAAPAPASTAPERRLTLVRAGRTASFALAARQSCGTGDMTSLAALNGVSRAARIEAGHLLKCVSVR